MHDQETLSVRDSLEDAYDAMEAQLEEEAAEISKLDESEEVEETDFTDTTAEAEGEKPSIEPEDEPILPPESWSAEAKQLFQERPQDLENLDPWTRKLLKHASERERERDTDYHRKTEEMASRGKYYDELDGIFEQDREWMELRGVTPQKRIQDLINAQRMMSDPRTRHQTFMELAQLYQIDPRQLFNVNGMQQQPQQMHPQQQQMHPGVIPPQLQQQLQEQAKRNQQLEKTVMGLYGRVEQQDLAAKKAVRDQGQQIIDSFKNAKDTNGNLMHPHWEAVSGEIVELAKVVKKENPHLPPQDVLAQAYDKACRVNDSVYEEIRKKEEAAKRAEAARAAKAAKKKGRSIKGAPEGSSDEKPMTVRDAVLAAAKKHNV